MTVGIALVAIGFGVAFTLVCIFVPALLDVGFGEFSDGFKELKCQWLILGLANVLFPLSLLFAWFGWLGVEMLSSEGRVFGRRTWMLFSIGICIWLITALAVQTLIPECPYPTR